LIVVSEAGVLVTLLLRAFTALSDGCLRDTTNDDAGNGMTVAKQHWVVCRPNLNSPMSLSGTEIADR
jgi:hypothetical protein